MALLAPVLTIACFARGGGGVPTTTFMPAESALIARGLVGYEHASSATFGFESLRLSVRCDLESAVAWCQNLLIGIVVFSPDAQIVWEGFLNSVTIQAGDEQVSVSLDGMANRVKCRYTTVLGTPGVTSAISSTDSQALFGVKDLVVALATTTSTPATNAATRKLADVAFPRMIPQSTAKTGEGGEVLLTLEARGWFETLDWVLTSRTSTTSTSTTTQVGDLLQTSSPGIGATNAFLSTSREHITSSGNSDTEAIDLDTPFRQKIEALLAQGNSSGQRLAYGVYEAREFYVDVWAGSTPTTIDYQRHAGEPFIRNAAYGVVPWWDVRPNKMYQRNNFLDVGPVTGQSDTAGRFAIERVTCAISGNDVSLTIEGPQSGGADAFIARLS